MFRKISMEVDLGKFPARAGCGPARAYLDLKGGPVLPGRQSKFAPPCQDVHSGCRGDCKLSPHLDHEGRSSQLLALWPSVVWIGSRVCEGGA